MDTPSYKVKTSDPCAFRKVVLKETLIVLRENRAKEVSIIESAFKHGGIKKPKIHNHPNGFDFYWVKCSAEEADTITSYLFDAEAAAVPDSGETTPEARRYAELVDIWTNFRNWLEGGGSVNAHWECD